ncbi:MAG: EamA family transporter, partial [Luteibaculum sp.]
EKLGPNNWKLPLILFLGSGVIDSLLKLTEHYFFKANPSNLFIASVFFLAGLFGLCYLLIFEKTKAKNLKNPQGIIFGGILGAVNFGSIFFLLQSLSLPNMEASVIFPINNVGIVALSSLFGLVLFKQKLGTIKFFGLLCAVTAVLLLSI